jgi:ADP-heptose:LPS heptosyltransferase
MNYNVVKKIGVFRALYLGDMLCIIPAVRAIKEAYPNASITLIGLPWQRTFQQRFSNYFCRFIEFPGWPGLPEQPIDPKKIWHFVNAMQDEHFDLVLQMQGHGAITNSMCMLWGARHVAGLRRPNDYCPDEKLFPVSEDSEHEILRYLKLVNALHLAEHGTHLEFPFFEDELKHFNTLCDLFKIAEQSYVCLHPGARDPKRRWPVENFAYIANDLVETGHRIVLTGSSDEKDLLRQLAERIKAPVVNSIELCPELSLGDLALLIKNCRLLVSNDTGVSHIAAALETPSVVIFSPYSDQGRWAPLNTSLHKVVSAEKSAQADYVLSVVRSQLVQFSFKSLSLFN